MNTNLRFRGEFPPAANTTSFETSWQQKTNPRRKILESPDGTYWHKAGPHDANLDLNMHIHVNKTWNNRNCTRKHTPQLREKCIQQRRCNAGGNKENKILTGVVKGLGSVRMLHP
ncbi:uncharacterized protein EAE97_001987 [Botrytis byssoidea]|uniref:Uncharacterized protein n=1 Tax=Botrytis byssoidea TaxID=139641 RepID=A0A9P5ISX0_9HELO|nr:uncharacterized protein EAE97_001987 [Botrytis byssoidea]KAF7952490.1 hypothetical protein EAE97_001987 [Botrytis byssoidea]